MPNHNVQNFVERRSRRERRSLLSRLAGTVKRGRRGQLRRAEDRRKLILLDYYPKPLMAAAVAILLLSLCDAILTLFLIAHGAVELNPVMDHMLKKGPFHFVMVKYWLTASAVIVFLLLNHHPLRYLNITVRSFLSIFTLIFSAVIVWQIYLIKTFIL
jgi:hypothetical protein